MLIIMQAVRNSLDEDYIEEERDNYILSKDYTPK